jgi:type IV pilus assembly protein PilB
MNQPLLLSPSEFVQYSLPQAAQKNASDVHFEVVETSYRVRFRLDGLLFEMGAAPLAMKEQIIAYLKVMAHLDTAEKRQPQDGRFQLTIAGEMPIDCRISSCPTVNGEKLSFDYCRALISYWMWIN